MVQTHVQFIHYLINWIIVVVKLLDYHLLLANVIRFIGLNLLHGLLSMNSEIVLSDFILAFFFCVSPNLFLRIDNILFNVLIWNFFVSFPSLMPGLLSIRNLVLQRGTVLLLVDEVIWEMDCNVGSSSVLSFFSVTVSLVLHHLRVIEISWVKTCSTITDVSRVNRFVHLTKVASNLLLVFSLQIIILFLLVIFFTDPIIQTLYTFTRVNQLFVNLLVLLVTTSLHLYRIILRPLLGFW